MWNIDFIDSNQIAITRFRGIGVINGKGAFYQQGCWNLITPNSERNATAVRRKEVCPGPRLWHWFFCPFHLQGSVWAIACVYQKPCGNCPWSWRGRWLCIGFRTGRKKRWRCCKPAFWSKRQTRQSSGKCPTEFRLGQRVRRSPKEAIRTSRPWGPRKRIW